ncbi:MAG: DUF4091 domain-containing protein [Armatimonadetes bacterium]|nr:DUF4091 domain-containing protein [Armatimonadota bacterium]
MRRFRLVVAVILALATVALLRYASHDTPRARARQTSVWAVSDLVTVRPDDAPTASNAVWDGKSVRLQAARNEVVAWQVALRPASPVAAGQVTLPVLTSDKARLPAEAVTAFTEHLLTVKVPSQESESKPALGQMGVGEFANQLLPLIPGDAKHGTFQAAAGRAAALWFEVVVPTDVAPGLYRGTLALTLMPGQKVDVPVELRVLALTLPRETHLRNWFYYGPEQLEGFYGAGGKAVESSFRRLAHDHRINLAPELYPPSDAARRAAWWSEQHPWIDGTAYEAGPCAGVAQPVVPIGLPDREQATVEAVARAAVAAAGEHGLGDRLLLYGYDEPNDREAYDAVRRIGRWVDDTVGDRLPLMVTESIAPQDPAWGSLEPAVDIFCSAQSSSSDMRRWHERGGKVWVYNGGLAGPGLIDCPLTGVAAWGPCAWRFDLDGWFQWDTLYWRQKHVGAEHLTDLYVEPLTFDETLKRRADGSLYPARDALRLNGDGVWFYPGEPVGLAGPVATLRAKAFRRGAQDYEYLWLLAQKGQRTRAGELARRLSTGRFSYETDADAWSQVRAEAARLLVGE